MKVTAMAIAMAVVARGFKVRGFRAIAMRRFKTGARSARKRQGNWRTGSSGVWLQMGDERGVRRRVMVMARIVRGMIGAGFLAGLIFVFA